MTTDLRLQIDGMTCGSCLRHVREAIGALPGATVEALSLDAPARIRLDGEATPDDVRRAVAEAGYEATTLTS